MGEGSYKKIAEVITKLACQRIFIALDAALLKSEFYAGIAGLLQDAKVKSALFTDIEPDPSAHTVEKAFAVCQAHQAAAILAIGNPVALEASADDRDTRGFISITMSRPSSGCTAN